MTLALGLFLGGCSEIGQQDSTITGSSNSNEEIPFNLTHHQYPEAANYAPEGYQLINIVAPTNRSVNLYFDFDVAEMINQSKGGDVMEENTGITIGAWGLPNSSWIGFTFPEDDEPWIDFEPHGMVFNSTQNARISFAGCEFPEGVDPQDLTVFYWNEELEEYEYIGGTLYPELEYLEYDIDHFSRYIVASRLLTK